MEKPSHPQRPTFSILGATFSVLGAVACKRCADPTPTLLAGAYTATARDAVSRAVAVYGVSRSDSLLLLGACGSIFLGLDRLVYILLDTIDTILKSLYTFT